MLETVTADENTTRNVASAEDDTTIRTMRFAAVLVAITAVSGCATIAGGLIGTGVGLAAGHPVSGALVGTGVGMMIDAAPRRTPPDAFSAPIAP